MKPVAVSKSRVLAGEIFADRKRHTKRGYFAIVFVTLLGAAFGWYIHGGIFYTLTVAAFALGASTITAAIINTDHHIYHRTSGFGRKLRGKPHANRWMPPASTRGGFSTKADTYPQSSIPSPSKIP